MLLENCSPVFAASMRGWWIIHHFCYNKSWHSHSRWEKMSFGPDSLPENEDAPMRCIDCSVLHFKTAYTFKCPSNCLSNINANFHPAYFFFFYFISYLFSLDYSQRNMKKKNHTQFVPILFTVQQIGFFFFLNSVQKHVCLENGH